MRRAYPWLLGTAVGWTGLALAVGCGGGGAPQAPFGLAQRVPVTTLTFPLGTPTPGSLSVVDAFPNLPAFASPVFVTSAPSGADRLFVVEQRGRIRVFQNDPTVSTYSTFLDITSTVTGTMGEEGLLGLAFDPNYATNGFFYVNYVAAGSQPRTSVIARYHVSSNPDVAETTETRLLTVGQPFTNHNGGMLAFGPDGYLYCSFGDGGSGGDPQNNGLNTSVLLGKILRIDPAGSGAGHPNYAIPHDNPFEMSTGGEAKEIYAYGLRNPWRFSFDRASGALWCGDVGQDAREEIDLVRNGGNYGWRAWEGNQVYSPSDAGRGPFDAPLFAYSHSVGDCIIGGYVYRGAAIPSLYGAYLYGDNGTGQVYALTAIDAAVTSNVAIDRVGGLSSFGEDRSGEVYMCSLDDGRLYTLHSSSPGPAPVFPALLSATGIYSDLATLAPSPGLVPYDVNVALWSDGALKDRLLALPGTEEISASADGVWTFPSGTVLVKTFRLPLTKGDASTAVRVETRVLILSASGWSGYTYRWRNDQTDADLLADTDTRTFTITDPAAPGGTFQQTWTFPSRSDCMRCHTAVAGRVLGLATRQLNRDYDYGGLTDNQLRSWQHIRLITPSLPAPVSLPAFPPLGDTTATVADRARAYLHVNCSMCHQPGGPSAAMIDLRSTVSVAAMNALGQVPQHGNLGLLAPFIIAGGDKANSVLWLRMGDLGTDRMPELGTSLIDVEGRNIVGSWIDGGP